MNKNKQDDPFAHLQAFLPTIDKLGDTSQFLINIFEALTHPFYVIDASTYQVLMANKAAIRQNKNNCSTCFELTHHRSTPCNGTKHPCPLQIVKETGKPTKVQHIHFDADENERFVEVSGYPVFNDSGQVIQMIEYSIDITDKVRIQEELKKANENLEKRVQARTQSLKNKIEELNQTQKELKKLFMAIEQTPNSIIITNKKAEIEYVNPAFEHTSGYQLKEIIGKNPRLLNSGKTPKSTFEAMWQALHDGKSWHGNFQNRKKDGTEFHEHIVISPIVTAEGELTHYVAVKQDITELIKAQAKAESANLSKSHFLANMSHEIRTPLNGILGFLDLLKETQLDSNQTEYLFTIENSADNLLRVINDILDFSKIESGKLDIDPIPSNIGEELESVITLFNAKAREKQILLLPFIEPILYETTLCLDTLRLKQVISNLMSNAVKFTPDKGQILFNATVEKNSNSFVSVHFSVKDTGIGIPKEKHKDIFDSFSQADTSTTRQFGGTGLGLAICRQLIELMGGKLNLISQTGKGANFLFSLNIPLIAYESSRCIDKLKQQQSLILFQSHKANHQKDLFIKYMSALKLKFQVSEEEPDSPPGSSVFSSSLGRHDRLITFGMAKLAPEVTEWCQQKHIHVVSLDQPDNIKNTSPKLLTLSAVIKALTQLENGYASPASSPVVQKNVQHKYSGRVLLAEDNTINLMLMQKVLQSLGQKPHIAKNGKEAYEQALKHDFDLILMDISMPIMNGTEAMIAIRKHHLKVPIIAVTAHSLKGDREMYLEQGFNGYISKPIKKNEIIKLFDIYLGKIQ